MEKYQSKSSATSEISSGSYRGQGHGKLREAQALGYLPFCSIAVNFRVNPAPVSNAMNAFERQAN